MTAARQKMRAAVDSAVDALEMVSFTGGFAAAINILDELSNSKYNEGELLTAEVLRWAAAELRGDNDENDR